MDNSAITCNEIIESHDEDADVEAKSYGETNFNGSSQWKEVFYEKVVLKNFAKFTGKHL